MAFQNEHGLTVDGFAGRDVWQALIADVIAGKPRSGGYSYVFVHSTVPQSLNLWHDGQVILTSPGNTGVPAAPTQLGTFPVFEHIPVGTMSGTNPDGSHYNDPGIRYISYFNHGEAIHAFNRAPSERRRASAASSCRWPRRRRCGRTRRSARSSRSSADEGATRSAGDVGAHSGALLKGVPGEWRLFAVDKAA